MSLCTQIMPPETCTGNCTQPHSSALQLPSSRSKAFVLGFVLGKDCARRAVEASLLPTVWWVPRSYAALPHSSSGLPPQPAVPPARRVTLAVAPRSRRQPTSVSTVVDIGMVTQVHRRHGVLRKRTPPQKLCRDNRDRTYNIFELRSLASEHVSAHRLAVGMNPPEQTRLQLTHLFLGLCCSRCVVLRLLQQLSDFLLLPTDHISRGK